MSGARTYKLKATPEAIDSLGIHLANVDDAPAGVMTIDVAKPADDAKNAASPEVLVRLVDTLNRTDNVAHFRIRDNQLGKKQSLADLESTRLETLDCANTDTTMVTAARVLMRNPNLTDLNLADNKMCAVFNRVHAIRFSSAVYLHRSLHTLSLSGNDLVNPLLFVDNIVFWSPILSSESLRKLDLSYNVMSPHAFSIFVKYVKDSNLTSIRLSGCLQTRPRDVVDEKAITSYACSLGTLITTPSLTDIDLSQTDLSSIMPQFSRHLTGNQTLQTLGLRACCLTTESIVDMLPFLLETTSLRALNLGFNHINTDGLMSVSDALTNPGCTLDNLNLQSCGITDISTTGRLTSHLLNQMRTLRVVNLVGNHDLTANGGLVNEHGLFSNRSLTDIMLNPDLQVTKDALEQKTLAVNRRRDHNWARLAILIAFVRANHGNELLNSVLPVIRLITSFTCQSPIIEEVIDIPAKKPGAK